MSDPKDDEIRRLREENRSLNRVIRELRAQINGLVQGKHGDSERTGYRPSHGVLKTPGEEEF